MAVLAANKGVAVTTMMNRGATPWRGGGVTVSSVTGNHGSSRNDGSGVGLPGSRRSHGQRRVARLPEELGADMARGRRPSAAGART